MNTAHLPERDHSLTVDLPIIETGTAACPRRPGCNLLWLSRSNRRSNMMRPTALMTVLVAVFASYVSAQTPRQAQPLLGVGEPPPAAPASAAASFFDDGTLQEIRLDINAKDWETLKIEYLANTYYPADFRWNGQVVRNVGIRSRGTASRSGVKPGLEIGRAHV